MPARAADHVALPQPLHADDDLLVALKPAGLLAVPGRGADKADCLWARLQELHGPLQVVHRLDMATSGLMVFARRADAQRRLSAAFAERRVQKRYVAIVAGCVAEPAGEIDLPLAADWPRRPLQRVDPERGRPSHTRWMRAEPGPAPATATGPVTRLDLWPTTGRSHQLRVHLQAIGHPILGDTLYAPPDVAAQAPRLLLHACELGFDHPDDGRPLRFSSPAPF